MQTRIVLREETVRWRLRDLGISAKVLGDRIGVNESAVSRLLTGSKKCDIKTASRIANALVMPIDVLADHVAVEAAA